MSTSVPGAAHVAGLTRSSAGRPTRSTGVVSGRTHPSTGRRSRQRAGEPAGMRLAGPRRKVLHPVRPPMRVSHLKIPRTALRTLAVTVVLTCAVTLAGPALADRHDRDGRDERTDLPSAQEVRDAKALAAQRAGDVGRIQAALLLANQRMETAAIEAEHAAEEANGAQLAPGARRSGTRTGPRRCRAGSSRGGPPARRHRRAGRVVVPAGDGGHRPVRDDDRRRARGRARPVRRLPGSVDVAGRRLPALRRRRRARRGLHPAGRHGATPPAAGRRRGRRRPAARRRRGRRRPAGRHRHRGREGPADPRARARPGHLGRAGPHAADRPGGDRAGARRRARPPGGTRPGCAPRRPRARGRGRGRGDGSRRRRRPASRRKRRPRPRRGSLLPRPRPQAKAATKARPTPRDAAAKAAAQRPASADPDRPPRPRPPHPGPARTSGSARTDGRCRRRDRLRPRPGG